MVLAISRPDLFQKIGRPMCPIIHDSVSEPFFTTCNEGETRAKLMDKICKRIYETEGSPSWYTENGIRFEEAMEDLHIPQNIRERIGPRAPASHRLLSNGLFNEGGLHIYDRQGIFDWIGSRRTCPTCTLQSNITVSKAYYCYTKYNDPHYYLQQQIDDEFQINALRNRIQRGHRWENAVNKVTNIFRNYLIPIAAFTIDVYYFLYALDIFFKTNLRPHLFYLWTAHQKVLDLFNLADGPLMFFVQQWIGLHPLFNEFRMYENILLTHRFYIRGLMPQKLVQGFAICYSAHRIGKLAFHYLQIRHPIIDKISAFHDTITHRISDVIIRIDNYVQSIFTRWGLQAFLIYMRTAFYLFTIATFFYDKVPVKVWDGFDLVNDALEIIFKGIFIWDSLKSLSFMMERGEVVPYLPSAARGIYNIFSLHAYMIYSFPKLTWLYSHWATYRDISWLLGIPNVANYIPFIRNYVNTPLANL